MADPKTQNGKGRYRQAKTEGKEDKWVEYRSAEASGADSTRYIEENAFPVKAKMMKRVKK